MPIRKSIAKLNMDFQEKVQRSGGSTTQHSEFPVFTYLLDINTQNVASVKEMFMKCNHTKQRIVELKQNYKHIKEKNEFVAEQITNMETVKKQMVDMFNSLNIFDKLTEDLTMELDKTQDKCYDVEGILLQQNIKRNEVLKKIINEQEAMYKSTPLVKKATYWDLQVKKNKIFLAIEKQRMSDFIEEEKTMAYIKKRQMQIKIVMFATEMVNMEATEKKIKIQELKNKEMKRKILLLQKQLAEVEKQENESHSNNVNISSKKPYFFKHQLPIEVNLKMHFSVGDFNIKSSLLQDFTCNSEPGINTILQNRMPLDIQTKLVNTNESVMDKPTMPDVHTTKSIQPANQTCFFLDTIDPVTDHDLITNVEPNLKINTDQITNPDSNDGKDPKNKEEINADKEIATYSNSMEPDDQMKTINAQNQIVYTNPKEINYGDQSVLKDIRQTKSINDNNKLMKASAGQQGRDQKVIWVSPYFVRKDVEQLTSPKKPKCDNYSPNLFKRPSPSPMSRLNTFMPMHNFESERFDSTKAMSAYKKQKLTVDLGGTGPYPRSKPKLYDNQNAQTSSLEDICTEGEQMITSSATGQDSPTDTSKVTFEYAERAQENADVCTDQTISDEYHDILSPAAGEKRDLNNSTLENLAAEEHMVTTYATVHIEENNAITNHKNPDEFENILSHPSALDTFSVCDNISDQEDNMETASITSYDMGNFSPPQCQQSIPNNVGEQEIHTSKDTMLPPPNNGGFDLFTPEPKTNDCFSDLYFNF